MVRLFARAFVLFLFLMPGLLLAQSSGGQFCVRAFEDRDSDGQRDADEPTLTRGLSINLLDANNITVASTLLEQSPTADQGIVCFVNLATGQYTISVTSAEYNPTTPTSLTTTISADAVPTVVDFGGRPTVASETPQPISSSPVADTDRDQLLRIVLAGLGALVVIAGMGILGVLIYLIAFRRRPQPDTRRTTGSAAVVKTGQTPKVE